MNDPIPVADPFWRHYPELVLLEITTYCNLECSYCFRARKKSKSFELTLDRFNIIKDRIRSIPNITFCGMGETLLHKNLYDMVQALDGHKIGIVTNGTVPIDFQRLNEKGNLYVVTFSIDGPDEETCRQICKNYNFETLLNNLREASRYPEIKRGLNCVVSATNLDRLGQLMGLAAQYDIQGVNFLLPAYDQAWVKANIQHINRAFRTLEEQAQTKDIYWIDPYLPQCKFGKAAIPFISLTGQVWPCCDYFGKVPLTGNILNKSFQAIWAGPPYQLFQSGKFCRTCPRYHNLGLPHYKSQGSNVQVG